MDSIAEPSPTNRIMIEPQRPGLTLIAVFGFVLVCFWLGVAYLALTAGGLSYWIVFPASMFAAMLSVWVCAWAFRRRANNEPAMIVDEVGIYDNVSIAAAGRLKWSEIEQVWIAGPRWMEFLCIQPDAPQEFLARQDDAKAMMMRFQNAVAGARIVIPMAILDIPSEDLSLRIAQVSFPSRLRRPHPPTPVSAARK
ncbi:MAG TPA: STM3941 family protein [Fimbriimonadaceae bacterium]|nr:STM3941 family protein [Fimbriimonadaceae bacterium]